MKQHLNDWYDKIPITKTLITLIFFLAFEGSDNVNVLWTSFARRRVYLDKG